MWKKNLFTMWFQDFVTAFNQSYNCQTSHYLGRNRPPNARLSILLFYSCLEPLVSLGMFFVRFVGAVLGGTLCVILGKTFGQFSSRFWRWIFRQFFKCFWHFSKLFQLSKLFDLSSFHLVVQVSQNTVFFF